MGHNHKFAHVIKDGVNYVNVPSNVIATGLARHTEWFNDLFGTAASEGAELHDGEDATLVGIQKHYNIAGYLVFTVSASACSFAVRQTCLCYNIAGGTILETRDLAIERFLGPVRTAIGNVVGVGMVEAHKDTHDPQDGSDPLDTAAPSETVGVQATGEGSAHFFARADHVHQIQHSIADNHLVTMDDAGPAAAGEYARFTANGIEGRTAAEVRSDINVGGVMAYTHKTSAYTATVADVAIYCDASGGAFPVTLPPAASHPGGVFYIKKTDSSVNAVTVEGDGAETIDGATTKVISIQYDTMKVQSDANTWWIL
jgi:hypothetical protein